MVVRTNEDTEEEFNTYGVSGWKDEKALEMDGGDGDTEMCWYLMP